MSVFSDVSTSHVSEKVKNEINGVRMNVFFRFMVQKKSQINTKTT